MRNLAAIGSDSNGHPIFKVKADRTKVSVQDVIAAEGPRRLDVDQAQKPFSTAIVVIAEHGSKPSKELIERANGIRERWIDYRATTTGRRSSICHYAYSRKKTAKTGIIRSLRYFLGYFPNFASCDNSRIGFVVDFAGPRAQIEAGRNVPHLQPQIDLFSTFSMTFATHQIKFGVDYRRFSLFHRPNFNSPEALLQFS